MQHSAQSLDFFNNCLGVITQYLEDVDVTDIMLNPDGRIWIETFSRGPLVTPDSLSYLEAAQIIRVVSGMQGQFFDAAHPSVATELPGTGARFQGVMPPQTTFPIFTIRKKPAKVFSLAEYLEQQLLTPAQYALITTAVATRQNILIAGATGSGKTTFANAVLKEVATLNVRVAILEDTSELLISVPNHYKFKTTRTVSMQQLLKDTLRMNIDSIVVGEVRGKEALDLLKAWNTGHPGGTATIHSDSAMDALYRLEQLVLEVATNCQRHLISKAINMVIFLAKNHLRQRCVQEILLVKGLTQAEVPYKIVKY